MATEVHTEHPHIVRVQGVAGGRPVIAGTRVSVAFLAGQLRAGDQPDHIIASYPHLPPAAVYDAISYSLDHRDEMDEELEGTTSETLAKQYDFTFEAHGKVVFRSNPERA